MIARAVTIVGLALLLAGCEDNEECKRLRALKASHERVVITMTARANLKDRAQARAQDAEARAKALLTQLGVDQTDEAVTATLMERAEGLKAEVQKGTRAIPQGDQPGQTEEQVLWSFNLSAKDAAAAMDQTLALAKGPPLLRFVALLSDGEAWRLRLGKADIPQVPINVAPMPAPERKSPDDIPSELGFCGASKLRSEIAALDREIEALHADAEATTVAMPTAASFEGLRSRAMLADLEENETRKILATLSSAALRGGLKVKALGVEGAVVIIELFGGPKEKVKFSEQLDPQTLAALKAAPNERPGVVRFMMVNRVVEQAKAGRGGH